MRIRRFCVSCDRAARPCSPDKIITKPFPAGVDDWSHPYHGPDNNPQSNDKVIVAPYLTQFLAEPRYAPLPQVAVTSAGRVFKAFGHMAFKEREEPWLNTLVAFNGYNGTMLWQRDLAEGVMIHRNTMVATPAALYFGDDKSCKVIDAATGKLLDEIVPPDGDGRRHVLEMDGARGRRAVCDDRRAGAGRCDQAMEAGQARLALGPDLGRVEPAREPLGFRPQRPGDRSQDEEGALEPSRGGADRQPGALHEPRSHLRLPVRRLPCLSRRSERPAGLAKDPAECSGALQGHWRVPEPPGLADELADHLLSQVQRQGPVLRRAADRQIAGRLRTGRQRPLGASVQQLPTRPARRRALRHQRPDRQAPEHEVRPADRQGAGGDRQAPPGLHPSDRRGRRDLLPRGGRLGPSGRGLEPPAVDLPDAAGLPGGRDRRQRPVVLVAVGVRLPVDSLRGHVPGPRGRFRFHARA